VGLRETINQKPNLITRVTVGVIVVALALIVYQQRSNRPAQRTPGEPPVYVPPAEDKPVNVPPSDPRKGTTTPARPPGRAALPRPRKLLVAAPTSYRLSTTEIHA
jgi:hypothetical protein